MSITSALKVRREALRNREDGFTLIELLVVVIIIGILAAIAIPIYIGVQNNAKDSATQTDLTNARTAVVAYYTAQQTFPAAMDAATLGSYGFSGPSGTNSNATPVNDSSATATISAFCLKATSDASNVWYINQASAPTKTRPAGCS